jgi:hypothetical protein
MKTAQLFLIGSVAAVVLVACAQYDAPENSNASDLRFTEPTFYSVQPVAYPHPTGCERCGFPDRLGSPEQ